MREGLSDSLIINRGGKGKERNNTVEKPGRKLSANNFNTPRLSEAKIPKEPKAKRMKNSARI